MRTYTRISAQARDRKWPKVSSTDYMRLRALWKEIRTGNVVPKATLRKLANETDKKVHDNVIIMPSCDACIHVYMNQNGILNSHMFMRNGVRNAGPGKPPMA